MASDANTRGIARIIVRDQDGSGEKHVGMATVIDSRHVLTCCHVLNDALKRMNRLDPTAPLKELFEICFPYANNARRCGKVIKWGLALTPCRDVAVIELVADAPSDAGIATFSEAETRSMGWSCIGADVNSLFREPKGELAAVLPDGTRQLNGPAGRGVQIESGYSGAPVWSDNLNAFVGIVVTKDREIAENALAYAIPTRAIADVWPQLVPLCDGRENQKIFRRPSTFVRRPELVRQVNECLTSYGICFLIGPKGVGKTRLAEMVYEEAKCSKAFLKCSEFSPEDIRADLHLLVLDNLTREMDREKLLSIPGLATQCLLTSFDRLAVEEIRSELNLADCPEIVIEVPRFTTQEGVDFLSHKIGDKLTIDQKAKLVDNIFGNPVALQTVAEFVRESHNPRLAKQVEVFISSETFDPQTVASVALDSWIREYADVHAQAGLRALSRIPFVGMSPSALAHVLGWSEDDLESRLRTALSTGFIRCEVDGGIREEMWTTHDMLRDYFSRLSNSAEDRRAELRYVEYLSGLVKRIPPSQLSISTCMDAWIVGVRSVFLDMFDNKFSWETFEERLYPHVQLMRAVWGRDGRMHRTAICHQIPALVTDKVNRANCSEIIALSRCLGALPASAVIGQTAWLGAQTEDSWARGASIWAAVEHWRQLGDVDRQLGINHLRSWVARAIGLLRKKSAPKKPAWLAVLTSTSQETSNDDLMPHELDLGAALAGLCKLGAEEEAIGYCRECADLGAESGLAVLGVAVSLADLGCQQTAIEFLRERNWPIHDGISWGLVEAYLIAPDEPTIHFDLADLANYSTRARDVGHAAHSHRFLNFVEALPIKSPCFLSFGLSFDLDRMEVATRFKSHARKGQFDEACATIEEIANTSDRADMHNEIAWEMATNKNEAARNGTAAIAHSTKACELSNWKNHNYLDTLAAAHAEASDFTSAEVCQSYAIDLLNNSQQLDRDSKLLEYIARLSLYRARRRSYEAVE